MISLIFFEISSKSNCQTRDFATITYLDGKVESVQLGETEQALNYEIEQMVLATAIYAQAIYDLSK